MAEQDVNPDNALIYGSDFDAIYLAPLGTPLPTSYDAPLSPAFTHVGWLDDSAGISESQSGSVEKKRGHQGGRVIRKIANEAGISFAFTAFETKDLTLGIRYDERNVTQDGPVRVSEFGPGMKVRKFAAVVDLRDRGDDGDAGERVTIPRLEVSSTGDRQATGTGIVGIPMEGEIIGSNNKRYFKPLSTGDDTVADEFTVTITGTPTGGTYALTLNGVATAAIAHNATHTDIAAALNALAGVTGISGITAATAAGVITVTLPTLALLAVGVVALTPSGTVTVAAV